MKRPSPVIKLRADTLKRQPRPVSGDEAPRNERRKITRRPPRHTQSLVPLRASELFGGQRPRGMFRANGPDGGCGRRVGRGRRLRPDCSLTRARTPDDISAADAEHLTERLRKTGLAHQPRTVFNFH